MPIFLLIFLSNFRFKLHLSGCLECLYSSPCNFNVNQAPLLLELLKKWSGRDLVIWKQDLEFHSDTETNFRSVSVD